MKAIVSLVFSALLTVGCSSKPDLVELAEQTLPKTVTITVAGVMERPMLKFDGENTFSIEMATVPVVIRGAGVYISQDNHVLTCDHLFTLVSISSVTVCNYDDSCFDATILSRESELDLALLRTTAVKRSSFVRIASPHSLRVGQDVFAIGAPLGFAFSVSHGIVSALNRDGVGVYNMTQSDTFINPGNSGGGLFNMKGELIGINSRMVPPVRAAVFTGLGFSVQSGQIIEFLTRVRRIDAGIPRYGHDYWTKLRIVLGFFRGSHER